MEKHSPYNYPQQNSPYMQNQPSYQQNHQGYPQLPSNNYNQEPILVGVPVLNNQIAQSYPQVQNAIPYPNPQFTQQSNALQQAFPYQHAQLPHPYQLPSTNEANGKNKQLNLSPQKQGYAVLNNETPNDNTFHTTNEHNLPSNQMNNQGNYPHLGNPMVSHETQFQQINAEMLFTPVVYDPNLLYQINSREPQLTLCKKCNKYVQTVVKYEIGVGTLISSGCLAFFGAIPCAFIPCCMKDLKDAVHHCPVCGDKLGVKKFIVN